MFKQSTELSLPTMVQKNLSSGRVYQVADGKYKGKVYPSITRVLKAKAKPQLEEWKEKVGEKEANLVSYVASLRGTRLHALAEAYLTNQPLPRIEPFERVLWQFLQPWLTKHVSTVYKVEVDLFSNKLGVAGRTDGLVYIDDMLSVIDFKQANKPKLEKYIGDYKLQGTFYALAAYELTGVPVKQIVIPITSPEGTEVFRTTPRKHYHELLDRIALFYENYDPEQDLTEAGKVDTITNVSQ